VGHASFLVQFDGLNIVTDPIFSERCAPVQFAGPKRVVPPPFQVEELPAVDFVIISHNHYDHTDTGTIEKLLPKVGRWYVPLGIKDWLVKCGAKESQVTELDWWNEHQFVRGGDPQAGNGVANQAATRIVCTPCQHFSGRSLWDRCETLWASWSIIGPTKRFWFAGDTGYRTVPRGITDEEDRKLDLPTCPVFKEIGQRLGPFDLACIPIGAYAPRWFMSPVHVNPMDAVNVHLDVRSKQSVGMHWGTFILTEEPLLEPPKRLAEELKLRGLHDDEFIPVPHGETRIFKAAK